MTPEEVVVARLESITAVTDIVGDRIYFQILPQGVEYPAVLVGPVGENSDYNLRGPVDLGEARVQVDAYVAETSGGDAATTANVLSAAIHGNGLGTSASGLSGWIGVVGSPAVQVKSCFRVSRLGPFYEAGEINALRVMQDYRLKIKA